MPSWPETTAQGKPGMPAGVLSNEAGDEVDYPPHTHHFKKKQLPESIGHAPKFCFTQANKSY